jgi:peptide/nickel transport system permease protein
MAVAALPSAPVLPKRHSAIVDFCRQQPLGALSFVVIFVMMFAGIFAERVAPYNPLDIDFAGILSPPSWQHWGGTDAFGRDILSRIIYGSRTALVIGFTSSFLGSSIGAILGIASAYFGGRIDNWIQRFMDILLAFPIIVLALVVVAALRKFVIGGIDVNLIYAIAIPVVPRVARVVRAAALSVRVMPYVDAARAAGYSNSRIIFRHMAPNVAAPYLIMFTAFIAQAILLEASLSFLGLGVTEPTAAWGLMLSGNAADFYREAPWMILFPGAAISLAVFAFNLFGDSRELRHENAARRHRVPCGSHDERRGAALSDAPDHRDRARQRGRADRHHRPHRDGARAADPRPDHHHRERRRRVGYDRDRTRGARRSRRLHAHHRRREPLRGQWRGLSAHLRSRAGFRADLDAGSRADARDVAQIASGEEPG